MCRFTIYRKFIILAHYCARHSGMSTDIVTCEVIGILTGSVIVAYLYAIEQDLFGMTIAVPTLFALRLIALLRERVLKKQGRKPHCKNNQTPHPQGT